MVELLVVIAIVAMLTAFVVIQSTGARAGLDLRSAANAVVADINHARLLAVRKGMVNDMAFDDRQRHYRTSLDGAVHPLPDKLRISVTGQTSLRGVQMPPRISFFPDGTVTAGNLLLEAAGRQVSIQISWLTGRATIHE